MKTALRLSPLVLLSIAACAGNVDDSGTDSQDLAPAMISALPQTSVSHSLPRGGSSTMSIRTLPNATCTLRPASEAPGAKPHLRIYSDDDGIARVQLQDSGSGASVASLALDCANDAGSKLTHSLNVQLSQGVRGQLPAAYVTAGKKVLPALDVDPLSMSREEMSARNYPPRPDPTAAPAQYQKWLSLIAKRPTVITPHMVEDATRVHGASHVANSFGTSTNWSGYVISTGSSASQYGEIFGAWNVPHASAESGFWYLNYSSLWVGIDGWGTPDVVQAGTDQNTETIFGVQFASYGAWTEWYPLSSKSISNFPVNSGDEIYTWVWVGNSSDVWTPSGGVGWFYVWNVTQNVVAAYLSTAAPSGTVFNGHQAEWVMERPTVGGSVANLTNYSTAKISDAWAYDYAGKTHYYTSDTSVGLSMVNGKDVLSTVAPVDSMTMQFTWHNYN